MSSVPAPSQSAESLPAESTDAEWPPDHARPVDAAVEAELRRLLGEALRKGRLDRLLCEHEPGGDGAGKALDQLVPLALILTAGFFVSSLLGLDWFWWALNSFVAAAVYYALVALATAQGQRVANFALWTLVIVTALFWPVTFVVQLWVSGVREALYTHVVPVVLVLPIFVANVLARRVLRVLRFVRYMPALLLATLGVLLIPMFTQELWRLAAETDLLHGLALILVIVAGILVLNFLAWRGMSQPEILLDETARRVGRDPSQARDEALHLLRSMVRPHDNQRLLGRGVVQAAQSDVAEAGRTLFSRHRHRLGDRPQTSDHNPHVETILESSFEDRRLRHYTEMYIRPLAGDLFGGRLLLERLAVLTVLLTAIAFLVFYTVAAFLVPKDVGEEWSGERVPDYALLSRFGIDASLPFGPYIWLSLTFALVATAAALTFILTNQDRRAELMKSLGDEIRHCVLIGVPYYHLPTNDTFATALAATGFRFEARCDNCRNHGLEPGEPEHGGAPGGASVWYRWTAPGDGLVELRAESDRFDPMLAVYRGSSLGTLSTVEGSRPADLPSSKITFWAKGGVEYRIAIDSPAGTIGSVELAGSLLHANDMLEGADRLEGANGTVRGHNGGARVETDEPLHAGKPGGASVWYRWPSPVDGRVVLDTVGSDFDTLLAIYTGFSVDALELVAANDDAVDGQSRLAFDAESGVDYLIAVDGFVGSTGQIVLNWAANDTFLAAATIEGAAGTVTGWNGDASKEAGEPDHGPNAGGGASIWYRWSSPSDADVTFAASSSGFDPLVAAYTGSSVDALSLVKRDSGEGTLSFRADAGKTYAIAVDGRDDGRGDVVLSWAANDAFSTAAELKGPGGVAAGWNAAATMEEGEPAGVDAAGRSVWYRWKSPGDGKATFAVDGSSDAIVAAYEGSVLTDLARVGSASEPRSVSFEATEGQTYSICVDGRRDSSREAGSGSFILRWQLRPPNCLFSGAVDLKGTRGSIGGWNAKVEKEPGEPDHAGNAGGASAWYRWEVPVDGRATVTTAGSSFDTLLAVYLGGGVDALRLVAQNDDDESGRTSSVSFPASAGETYAIAVDGFLGATGDIELTWDLVPPPANDDFERAVKLVGPRGTHVSANHGAMKQALEPDHAGHPGGASVWYRWRAPEDGWVRLTTDGSSFDTLLAVYTGASVRFLSLVASNDDSIGRHSVVVFRTFRNVEYRIAVDGFWGATGDVVLAWEPAPPPANDAFERAETIAGREGTVQGENWRATREPGEPDHAGGAGTASVWYRWRAPAEGRVRIATHGSGFDTVLAVYTGARVDALQLVDENDDVATGTPWSEVSFGGTAGEEYFIAVDGYRGAIGEFVLHWGLQSPPDNDDFAEPAVLSGPNGLEHGTNDGATKEPGEPDHAGQAGDASVWYRWTAPADGEMTIFTVGSTFDTLLAVYTGSRVDALTPVEANDDVASATWSAVSFQVVQGEVYSVAVDGYVGATGDVVVTWAFEVGSEG